MKVKFVIQGKTMDDIELSQHPQKGDFITWGMLLTQVREVEYQIESKGVFRRVIIRCDEALAETPMQSKFRV